ncbi:hypothetical protein GEMRC1_013001 [Eukaryota sp. GEM-RC1]
MPVSNPLLNTFFMTISTRVTGFSTIDLSHVSPPLLIILILLQILAVTPFISVLRSSEKTVESLPEPGGIKSALRKLISTQQLNTWARDFFWVYASWLTLTIIIYKRLDGWFLFNLLYEVSSSYGNIGLSMGYPSTESSFASETGTSGKFVFCLLMLAGRHRGLPSVLDQSASTLTFQGLAQNVLNLIPVEVLAKMNVKEAKKVVAKPDPELNPLLEVLIADCDANNTVTLTSSHSYLTFPP